MDKDLTEFVETNVLGLFSETLTADIQTVFSDQTLVGRTDTALSWAFTVSSWVREPNVFVSHIARERQLVKGTSSDYWIIAMSSSFVFFSHVSRKTFSIMANGNGSERHVYAR